jgi:subtilisin-like proprotein convertase family protein
MYSKAGGTISNTVPFNNTILKLQQIYLASDITTSPTAGYINRIYFRGVTASASATFSNLSVKIGQTTATVFSGGNTFFTGLTSVYSAATTTLTSASVAGNWFYLDLQNSFSYNPAQTLILEITFTAKTAGGINLYASTCPGAPNHKRIHATTTTATTGSANLTWNDIGIDVSNTAICTTPVTQATSLSLTPQSTTQINGSFTAASGADAYLVVQYPNGAATTSPVNGTTYSAGATLGLGTVVSAGVGTTFNSTNLAGSTSYDYYVYTYNFNCVNGPKYNPTSPLTSSASTLSCSTITSTLTASATPSTICQGTSSSLSASGASNYSWQPGGLSGATITVSPASTTTYTVTGTISGCPFTATALVNVNPQPDVVIQSSIASYPSCPSYGQLGTTTLTATGGTSYSWQPGGATTASITVSPTTASIYTVTATSTAGCTKTRSKVVQSNAAGVIIYSNAPPSGVYYPESITLKASGASFYSNWGNQNGWSIGSGNPITFTPNDYDYYSNFPTLMKITGYYQPCNNPSTAIYIPTIYSSSSPMYKKAPSVMSTAEGTVEKNQYLYLPGDISPAPSSGSIHRLYIHFGNNSATPILTADYSDFTVKLGQTTATAFSGNTNFFTGLSTVIYEQSKQLRGSTENNEWIHLDLPIPFQYDASKTLIVEISYSGRVGSLALKSSLSPSLPNHRRLSSTNLAATTGTVNYSWLNVGFDVTNTICNAPASQASFLDLTPVTTTRIDGAFVTSPSNPSGYLLVRYPEGAAVTHPSNGVNYLPNSPLGLGTILKTGYFTFFSDSGLAMNTVYDYYVYAYNDKCVGAPMYNTVNPLKMSETTMPCSWLTFPITVSATSPNICNGGSSTITASGADSYLWSPGGATTPSISVSPTSTTTYTVTCTKLVTGCILSNTTTKTISVVTSPPLLISSPSSIICPGASVQLTATGADSYIWQPGGQTLSTITVSPTSQTTYTVTGTIPGCSGTTTKTISLNTSPTLTITATMDTVCSGQGNTLLTASGANSYSWNTGQQTAAITVSPSAVTQYVVTGTSSNGCTSTKAKSIQVYPLPTLTISQSANFCYAQNPITMTAISNVVSYSWQPGGFSGATLTASPSGPTTYTVTGTSAMGCTNTATIFYSAIPKTVTASASPSSVCGGKSTTLTATTNASVENFYFYRTSDIYLNSYGPGNPYPETLNVSGLPSNGIFLKSIAVTLAHSWAGEINMWLESPSGQSVVLMNGAGGWYPVNDELIFEDGHPLIPDYPSGSYVPGGTYSPSDYSLVAPVQPVNPISALSSLSGNMNGNWKLYARDDVYFDNGEIYFWQLTFQKGDIQWTVNSNSTITSPKSLNTFSTVNTTSIYTVSITDAVGCSMSATTSVNVTPCLTSADVRAFIQGYYEGNNLMTEVLANQGVNVPAYLHLTDSVDVTLYDTLTLAPVATARCPISREGLINTSAANLMVYYGYYYMSVKHRNSIEVWSATPLYFSDAYLNYVFHDQASKAYGANQVQVAPGKWALYSGDINQDGFVDSFDFPALDTDIYNGVSGVYVNTDLNGDGFVDSFDFPIFDLNSTNGVSVITP